MQLEATVDRRLQPAFACVKPQAVPKRCQASALQRAVPQIGKLETKATMRIIVLDGYTLSRGDLSWDNLRQLAATQVYDRTEPSQIVDRARGAELVLTNKTPLSAETLGQLPNLRYIGVLATGYNCVDVTAAKELGVTVTNVPSYGTQSVAQFVFALLLELCHNVGLHSEAVRAGEWSQCEDWCFWRTPLVELDGKNLGVIGFGRIGRQVAKIGEAMGMHVLASAPRPANFAAPF